MDDLLQKYPTRQSIVDWLSSQIGFDDIEYVLVEKYDSAEVGVQPVIIEGYRHISGIHWLSPS